MNNNKIITSVIMSTYNEKVNWIKESIESILNQTNPNFEYIIVLDNPDNKEIENIVRNYEKVDKRIKVIRNEKNLGLVESLNKALKVAKGKYVMRMDADDISELNRLDIELEFLENNKLDLIARKHNKYR